VLDVLSGASSSTPYYLQSDLPIDDLRSIKNGRYRIVSEYGVGEQAITVMDDKIWTTDWAANPNQIVYHVFFTCTPILITAV
jgi:hypothetical protein